MSIHLDHTDCEGKRKVSFSRVTPIVTVSMMVTAFFLIVAGIMLKWWTWDLFDGAMSWGKDFVFISVIPYLGNVGGKAVGALRGGRGVGVQDVH